MLTLSKVQLHSTGSIVDTQGPVQALTSSLLGAGCAVEQYSTDERAFDQQDGSRGPVTRGDLAWLLTRRLLKKHTWVHHITRHPDDGRALQE